jgi:FkbM family methyltransferase
MKSERLNSFLNRAKAPFQRLVRPLGLSMSRRIAGHRFHFDPASDIGLQLLVAGRFEKDAIAICRNYIRPDGVVVDVGANIGVHAVHFAQFAPAGQVICFEPARSTFANLLRNIGHLDNVIALSAALSDVTGLQTLFVASDSAYSGLKDTKRKPLLRRETIACFRGDDILAPLLGEQRIDFIKIDVEGFEMQVLRGMSALIVKHRPVIFCEIFGGSQSNPDPQATVEFCTSLGYQAFVLADAALAPAGAHSDRLYNYFFIPRGAP